MQIIYILLVVLAGIIALLLILALFMRKYHFVKREMTINASRQKVFDYVKLLKNQETFNEGAMADPNRKKEFKGTDGTEGFIYAWSGNKDAGVGEKEIVKLINGSRVEMEIRFIKPMKTSARIAIETTALTNTETKVSWSNTGTLKYPLNIMIPMLEKHVVRDLDKSLSALKAILEKGS